MQGAQRDNSFPRPQEAAVTARIAWLQKLNTDTIGTDTNRQVCTWYTFSFSLGMMYRAEVHPHA